MSARQPGGRNAVAQRGEDGEPTFGAQVLARGLASARPSTKLNWDQLPRLRGQELEAALRHPVKTFREVDVKRLRQSLPPAAQYLAQAFVDAARKHNVDPLALASIARLETGHFKSQAFDLGGNAMGKSNEAGVVAVRSHGESIFEAARMLAEGKLALGN